MEKDMVAELKHENDNVDRASYSVVVFVRGWIVDANLLDSDNDDYVAVVEYYHSTTMMPLTTSLLLLLMMMYLVVY